MAPIINYTMLPQKDRKIVRMMLKRLRHGRIVDVSELQLMEWLADEAAAYRNARGWFVWLTSLMPQRARRIRGDEGDFPSDFPVRRLDFSAPTPPNSPEVIDLTMDD